MNIEIFNQRGGKRNLRTGTCKPKNSEIEREEKVFVCETIGSMECYLENFIRDTPMKQKAFRILTALQNYVETQEQPIKFNFSRVYVNMVKMEGAARITKQMINKSSTLEAHSAFTNSIEKMPESSFFCKTARTAKE